MQGTRPGKLPPPSQIAEKGRVCADPLCQTALSVYNTERYCWQHTELRFPNYRGKRLQPRAS